MIDLSGVKRDVRSIFATRSLHLLLQSHRKIYVKQCFTTGACLGPEKTRIEYGRSIET